MSIVLATASGFAWLHVHLSYTRVSTPLLSATADKGTGGAALLLSIFFSTGDHNCIVVTSTLSCKEYWYNLSVLFYIYSLGIEKCLLHFEVSVALHVL